MKKILYTFLLLTMPLIVNANSACSVEEQSELKTEANLIKVDYEILQLELDPSMYEPPEDLTEEEAEDYKLFVPYISINVLNMTDNFTIEVTNDYNTEVKTILYTDFVEGTYAMEGYNDNEVITYTFTVKTSDITGCPNENNKIFYLTTPKYNMYSGRDECLDFKDEPICQEFTTNENLSADSFYQKLDDLKEEKFETEDDAEETEESHDSNNVLLIVIIIVVVLLLGSLIIFRKKIGEKSNEKN